MKRCPSCGETQSLDAFPPNRQRADGRQAQCRACYAAYQRAYYRRRTQEDAAYRRRQRQLRRKRNEVRLRENRARLWAYFAEHPCVDCGEKDPVVLELDHRRPEEKRFTIGDAIFRMPWERIQTELGKCDVRCANCHRRRTAAQQGFYTYLDEGDGV